MVQILIKVSSDFNKDKEWAIIELQGNLETSHSDGILQNKLIGDLHFTKNGQPLFLIGHHILAGEIKILEKPLIVLIKKKILPELDSSNIAHNSNNSCHKYENMETEVFKNNLNLETNTCSQLDVIEKDNEILSDMCEKDVYYDIIAVIRKKIIFVNRPKPIVSNISKKA